MASVIARLAVTLGLDTAAFSAGSRKAQAQSKQLEGGLGKVGTAAKVAGVTLASIGAGVVIGAFQNAVAGAFEMASSLSEAAEQAGLTVEGLQELRFAADQTGVGAGKVEAAMKRLSKSLGDLQLGKKEAVDAFAAIGLSADELRGKRPDEALRVIADALNKLPDASQRVAIGQQLMGRGFSELLPLINGGSAALDDYAQKSRDQGQISTENAAKLDELADRWSALKLQVGVATANIIAAVIPAAEQVGAFLDGTRLRMHNFREAVIALPSAVINAVSNMVNGIKNWVTGTLGAIWDSAIAKIRAVEAAFKWLADKVVMNSHVPDMVQKIGYEMSSLNTNMVQVAETAAVRVEKTFKDMADATLNAFSRLTGAIKSGGFLGILEAVIGVGLQLGSIGAFGKGIATRINAPGGGTSGYVRPPKSASGGTVIQVNPSPYFDVVVDSRIGNAAPQIAGAGAAISQAHTARSKKWSLT